jgi:group I intron endonuclease
MKSGVYIIRNVVNGKVYVGSSIQIRKRWNEHRNQLRKHRHPNPILQKAWNRYGEAQFEFGILEEVADVVLLCAHEQIWIERLKALAGQSGYNVAPHAGSTLGVRPSRKTRRKLSIANKGKRRIKETRRRMSIAFKGRVYGPETRARMSAAKKTPKEQARIIDLNKARKWTKKKRQQIAEKIRALDSMRARDQYGRLLPVTTDPVLLAAAAGRPRTTRGNTGHLHSKTARLKMSIGHKGKLKSAETRVRMSVAQRARFARERGGELKHDVAG